MIGNCADEADLYLLRVSTFPESWRKWLNTAEEPSGEDQRIQKVAVLSAPAPNVVFKNFAVTSHLIGEQMVIELKHIVIAITWQNPSSDFSELYVYRIPENFGTQSSVSLPEIHGKRISSLSNRMGGTHQHSKLNLQENHTKDGLPGDMLIPSLVYQREQSDKIDDIAQKIIVRGATANNNANETDPDSKSIIIRVFDLSVPKPSHSSPNYERLHSRAKIRGSLQACTCPLHDTGYRLTLPATWHKVATDLTIPSSPFTWHKSVRNSSALTPLPTYSYPLLSSSASNANANASFGTRFTPTKASLFWNREPPSWMRDQPIEWTAEYGGSVEEDDPQRRKDALRREGEYVKELIRAMKEGGISETEIPNAWLRFGFGLVKPDGWRDL